MTDPLVAPTEPAAAETATATGTTPVETGVGASVDTGAVIHSSDLVRDGGVTPDSNSGVHVVAAGESIESVALLYGLGNAYQDLYVRNMSFIERAARESGHHDSACGALLVVGTLLNYGPKTASESGT